MSHSHFLFILDNFKKSVYVALPYMDHILFCADKNTLGTWDFFHLILSNENNFNIALLTMISCLPAMA